MAMPPIPGMPIAPASIIVFIIVAPRRIGTSVVLHATYRPIRPDVASRGAVGRARV